jgi:enoyl-CoA hydratase
MSDYEHIVYESERGRARVILNRPEKHNPISDKTSRELADAMWRADRDPDVHAVVLKGAGRSFCSGADLAGGPDTLRRGSSDGRPHIDDDAWQVEYGQRNMIVPFDMHKPVIAQVHGHCLAVGTVLALFCDMVICADDARIGFPPARDLGALPSNMWLYHVGPQWAKRLTMTGDTITGAEAAEIGFALKAVPGDLLEAEVEQLLDRLAMIDHHLLSANKRIINIGLELMGARTLQRLAAENDARAHLAPGTQTYYDRVREHGLREAFKLRDGQFGDGRARVRGPETRDAGGRLVED